MTARVLLVAVAFSVSAGVFGQQPGVRLYAAGSLRAALTDVANAFTTASGIEIKSTFGASGLLRERIEKGEPADVFASADMGNAQALASEGRASTPIVFTRNRLCALAAPGVEVESNTLLDRMLDPGIRLGTSTPKADPGGDYAWQLFEKADKVRPGAYRSLDAKALQLTGGPNSPRPPSDRSVYGAMIAEKKADIFLTYCTNVMQAVREVAGARSVTVPDALAVGAEYGLVTLNSAPPEAQRFATFVMSAEAQNILVRHGFASLVGR